MSRGNSPSAGAARGERGFGEVARSPPLSGSSTRRLTNVPPVGTLVCHKMARRLSTQSPSFNQEKRWPMANKTAKIVRFHSVGGPEVLQLDEVRSEEHTSE